VLRVAEFDVFMELMEGYVTPFRDKGKLALGYVPLRILHRRREERFLGRVLVGLREGYLPPMVRVFGGSGTGKTLVVRSVLERFERFAVEVDMGSVRSFYVNLRGCRSVFSAVNSVLSALSGRRLPNRAGLDRVYGEIWGEVRALRGAGGRLHVFFILDEVDSVFLDKHYDPSEFFYRFLRYEAYLGDPDIRVCLVAITNRPGSLDALDERVKSSMGSAAIMFPSYTRSELRAILEARAEEAFKPGALEEGVIDQCVSLVSTGSGDARRAIDLLRVIGEVAAERKSPIVMEEHVQGAWERVDRDWVREMIRGLPIVHRIVLTFTALAQAVGGQEPTTGDIYRFYNRGVEKNKLKPLGERRIAEVIEELRSMELLDASIVSKGRYGRTKMINLRVEPETVLDITSPGWREVKPT